MREKEDDPAAVSVPREEGLFFPIHKSSPMEMNLNVGKLLHSEGKVSLLWAFRPGAAEKNGQRNGRG